MKLNIDRAIYILLISNPLIALAFDGTTIRYYYYTLPIIFLLLSIKLMRDKKRKGLISVFLITSAFSIGLAFSNGGDIGKINNHLFNYLDCVLLFFYIAEKQNQEKFTRFVKQKINWIVISVYIIEALECVMIITRQGFEYNWNWGGTFFKGTSSMPHTMAYLMIMTIIFVIIIVIVKKRIIYSLLSIFPLLCIFMSGVRVALLPAGLLTIMLIDISFSSKSKSTIFKIIKALIFAGIVFVIFYDQILSSNMMAKILKRQTSISVSAGRIDIWIYLLTYFIKEPSKWLFGIGDQTIYYLNSINPIYHNEIWAHSDFIQILVGKGIICLGFYIYSMIIFLKSMREKHKKYYSYLMAVLILGLSSLNGFYNYRETMLGIPFIYVAIYLLNNEWFGYQIKRNMGRKRWKRY